MELIRNLSALNLVVQTLTDAKPARPRDSSLASFDKPRLTQLKLFFIYAQLISKDSSLSLLRISLHHQSLCGTLSRPKEELPYHPY